VLSARRYAQASQPANPPAAGRGARPMGPRRRPSISSGGGDRKNRVRATASRLRAHQRRRCRPQTRANAMGPIGMRAAYEPGAGFHLAKRPNACLSSDTFRQTRPTAPHLSTYRAIEICSGARMQPGGPPGCCRRRRRRRRLNRLCWPHFSARGLAGARVRGSRRAGARGQRTAGARSDTAAAASRIFN